jgi:hypothetical protein
MKKTATVLCILIILCYLTSCRAAAGSVFKNMPATGENPTPSQQQSNNNESSINAADKNNSSSIPTNNTDGQPGTTNNSGEGSEDLNSNPDDESLSASLFDYTAIKIDTTKSLDTEIKNCGIYMDIYGDLIILGEIKNSSSLYKTNVEITFDFYNSKGEILDSQEVKTIAVYILPGKSFPFSFIYDKKSKYIDLSKIKVGVNYKNYNKSFGGFPVAARKNFYYIDDMMIINGNVSNIGSSDIEDLKLTGIFYNYLNKVVFLKECYLARDKLYTGQAEDFVLKILLDEYTPQFTHFGFEASFRDTLKV